jgi:hypothetical protein
MKVLGAMVAVRMVSLDCCLWVVLQERFSHSFLFCPPR